MCCSVSPGVPVRFTDTVLYAAEVLGRDGEPVHVLGYQNRVQGRFGLASLLAGCLPFVHSGNAMILPFPAVPRTMTPANVLDTKDCRDILQDMADAVAPRSTFLPMKAAGRGWGRASGPPPVQVFQAAGVYTVILAQDPRDIPAALDQVPQSSRPALNPELFDAYARWYPGWTIALCCFSNRRARLANPLLWWYRPMFRDRLFLPAVDCHTGDVPDLRAQVDVGHVLAVGSYRATARRAVHFRDDIPAAVAPYLCPWLIGRRYAGLMPNGDFVCRLDDVRQGRLQVARSVPMAA